MLTLENIKQFADEVPLNLVRPMIERQIRYNMDIAYEGISGDYGLGIGRVLRESYADGVVTRMKAYAAAASEARMSGCDMPVIINSGSGNQGIASSVPVIVYAREKNYRNDELYRALVFSGLLTTYQKCLLENCLHFVVRFLLLVHRLPQSLIYVEEVLHRLKRRLTIHWQIFRELSVMVQKSPVQQKLHPV